MLATANMIPDLPVIPNTSDVIASISRQSIQVASLIHEYTKLSLAGDSLLYPVKLQIQLFFTERTVKIQGGDLKSRIDKCQKDCASLKDTFYNRLHLDTNIQVKGIGRTLKAIKDDKLGTFKLHSSLN
jgi:hypothetical protein